MTTPTRGYSSGDAIIYIDDTEELLGGRDYRVDATRDIISTGAPRLYIFGGAPRLYIFGRVTI